MVRECRYESRTWSTTANKLGGYYGASGSSATRGMAGKDGANPRTFVCNRGRFSVSERSSLVTDYPSSYGNPRWQDFSDRSKYNWLRTEYDFDDLSDGISPGRHQPLRVWVGCLYLHGIEFLERLDYSWGGIYAHQSMGHSAGEYAQDEDGDGFCKIHMNTMEEVWSLLRSWLRPHWGISQEALPQYLGFFEFVHNAKETGQSLFRKPF